jgi:nicotinamidase-related amidase
LMSTALILIDLQVRIVGLPLEPHSGHDVVDRCRRLAVMHRAHGIPVVLIRVERPNVTAQPPGSELVDGFVELSDVIITKRAIGAFHQTDLHHELQRRKVAALTLAGLVTNFGVESTGRAAVDFGYELTFVSDAMSGRTEAEHNFAVDKILPQFGRVVSTDELTESLGRLLGGPATRTPGKITAP